MTDVEIIDAIKAVKRQENELMKRQMDCVTYMKTMLGRYAQTEFSMWRLLCCAAPFMLIGCIIAIIFSAPPGIGSVIGLGIGAIVYQFITNKKIDTDTFVVNFNDLITSYSFACDAVNRFQLEHHYDAYVPEYFPPEYLHEPAFSAIANYFDSGIADTIDDAIEIYESQLANISIMVAAGNSLESIAPTNQTASIMYRHSIWLGKWYKTPLEYANCMRLFHTVSGG